MRSFLARGLEEYLLGGGSFSRAQPCRNRWHSDKQLHLSIPGSLALARGKTAIMMEAAGSSVLILIPLPTRTEIVTRRGTHPR